MNPEKKQRIIGMLVIFLICSMFFISLVFINNLKIKKTEKNNYISKQIEKTSQFHSDLNDKFLPQINNIDNFNNNDPKTVLEDKIIISDKTKNNNTNIKENILPIGSSNYKKTSINSNSENNNIVDVMKINPKFKKHEKINNLNMKKNLDHYYWAVQIGCFSDNDKVQKMVDRLQRYGYKIYLQKLVVKNINMTRVIVGNLLTREDALILSNELKSKLKNNVQIIINKK